MSDDVPEAARRAFGSHEAFQPGDSAGTFDVTTVAFEATVRPREASGHGDRYELVVRFPSLDAATADHVGPSVQSGWFETMERRLREAPAATRASVDLDAFRLEVVGERPDDPGEDLAVHYAFTWGEAGRAAAIAKAFAEYVEGTYVESVVPGYDYVGVVADLLGEAATTGGEDGDGGRGGTPL